MICDCPPMCCLYGCCKVLYTSLFCIVAFVVPLNSSAMFVIGTSMERMESIISIWRKVNYLAISVIVVDVGSNTWL